MPDRRRQLVEDILRLRRAEAALPSDAVDVAEPISAVRRNLEAELGRTVPRATAARVLGVSAPALARWIARGDVPVMLTPSGRREVPLAALLDIADTMALHSGKRPLGAALRDRRAEAERLTRNMVVHGPSHDRPHASAEAHALAYHRAVAARLDPSLLKAARERLERWQQEGKIAPRYSDRWRRVLALSPTEVARAIVEDSPVARDLRQNSPFAGALSEPERRRVRELLAAG